MLCDKLDFDLQHTLKTMLWNACICTEVDENDRFSATKHVKLSSIVSYIKQYWSRMSKSSMNVSSNDIARFLYFGLKMRNIWWPWLGFFIIIIIIIFIIIFGIFALKHATSVNPWLLFVS